MRHRVLVVEDNQPNRELLCDWLEAEGFEAFGTDNLEQAYAAFKNRPPEAVLLDVQLGKEDGLRLATWTQREQELRIPPVIAGTAHAMAPDRGGVIRAGCNPCFPNPVIFNLP